MRALKEDIVSPGLALRLSAFPAATTPSSLSHHPGGSDAFVSFVEGNTTPISTPTPFPGLGFDL